MKNGITNQQIFDMIIEKRDIVWSPKSGLAKAGSVAVLLPRSERLHRLRNFTLYRLESFLDFNRSTLSDFEFDYYLSAIIDSNDIVYLDVARVFPTMDAAKEYTAKNKERHIIKLITK